MSIHIQPAAVVSVGTLVQSRKHEAGELSKGVDTISGEAVNPTVSEALTAWASTWTQALTVAGDDIGVLGGRVSKSATLYAAVDQSVVPQESRPAGMQGAVAK